MAETVADVIERYKELKESINKELEEFKDSISDLKHEVSVLKDVLSESKGDLKTLLKEIQFLNERNQDLKEQEKETSNKIDKCPFCKSEINLDNLNTRAYRAYAIASINITLTIGIVIVLILALIKHDTI